jgi:hypothetical protein
MKAGDLVKITRTQIGAPEGTIGLIVKTHEPRAETMHPRSSALWR